MGRLIYKTKVEGYGELPHSPPYTNKADRRFQAPSRAFLGVLRSRHFAHSDKLNG